MQGFAPSILVCKDVLRTDSILQSHKKLWECHVLTLAQTCSAEDSPSFRCGHKCAKHARSLHHSSMFKRLLEVLSTIFILCRNICGSSSTRFMRKSIRQSMLGASRPASMP